MGKFEFKVDFHRETPQYEYINEKMNTLWKNMTNEMKMYNRNSTDIEKKIESRSFIWHRRGSGRSGAYDD